MTPTPASIGGAKCPTLQELTAYRDGRLGRGASATIHDHLAACPACERLFGELRTGERLATSGQSEGRQGETLTGGAAQEPSLVGRTVEAAGAPAASLPKVIGYYEILDRLGRGGMGDVYRARHVRLKRDAAFKILPLARMASPAAVARFMREVEAVGRLEHPNIVRALDAGEAEGVHYLVMEVVEGIDLARLAALAGPLPLAEACELVRQAAVGLQYAHEHDVVHRDVKPSNLMVTPAGQVKILDLGLALLRREGDREDLTQSGLMMGTADYMAPEQWFDAHAVDIRADLYSLGCTLFRLLTGTPPFGGPNYESLGKKMDAHARVPVSPLRDYRPDIPAGFVPVLERLLAKAPADRYQTPQEAGDALAPFAAPADLPGLMRRLREGASSGGSSDSKPLSVPPPPSRSISTIVASRSSWGLRSPVVLITLAALGVCLAAVAWRFLPPPKAVEVVPLPIREVVPPTEMEVGKWTVLLKREPERLWPRVPPADFFSLWDEKKLSLRIHSPTTALFALGEVRKPAYRFQVGISQTPWEGRVGVFIGYRPWQGPNGAVARCQLFELKRAPDRPSFTVQREELTVHQGSAPDAPTIALSGIAKSPTPHPVEMQENMLEVEVKGGRVRSVRWNSQFLPDLVKAEFDTRLPDGDHAGVFGVYCSRGHGLFQSARIMILPGG
jgi:serine/threonine protein kinase